MLKKIIKFNNPFTNEEVTEEHYFHISKADLVEMEMEEHGSKYQKDGQTLTGMQAKLQKIIDSEDGKAIMAEFKDIIRRSYGKKEGDRFLKSPAIWAEFESTEAFSQLLFELCTNAGAAAEFMNGVVPNNLDQIAAEVRAIAEREEPSAIERGADAVERGTASVEQGAAALERGATALEADPTGLTKEVTPRVLSPTEVAEMDAIDLKAGLATGRYKLS